MNILRSINYENNVGSLIDLEYIKDSENNFKCVDLRIYKIINNSVGSLLDINIVTKLGFAEALLKILEKNETNKNEDV